MDVRRVEPEVLNLALELSLEFGPAWRQPIQARLHERRPELTAAQVDELEAFARHTRDWAHDIISKSINTGIPTEREARRTISVSLSWMAPATFARLWSQGCYYASK